MSVRTACERGGPRDGRRKPVWTARQPAGAGDFFRECRHRHALGESGREILWVNQAELDLLGYTPQEYLGHHIAEFHVDQDGIADILQRLASHEPFHDYEARLRSKDGSVRHMLIDAYVLWEDGEFIHTRCMTRDITERKRTKEALRRRIQELEAMLAIANTLAGPEPFETKAHKMLIEMKVLGQGDLAVLRLPMKDGKGLLAVANSGAGALAGEPPAFLPFGKSVSSLAYEHGEPVVANDYAAHPRAVPSVSAVGIRSMAVFPLKVGGAVLGIVSLSSGQKDHFTAERVQLFTAIASEIGVLVENARLQGETGQRMAELDTSRRHLELLSRRLLAVQETERRDMARELHDEIGQLLTSLHFTLEIIERSPTMAPEDTMHKARAVVDDLMARVRGLSLDLRPPMLDDLGLLPTLLWHFERFSAQTHVAVRIRHQGLSGRRLPPEIEIAAFRVVQEASTNIVRHAGVQQAEVRIRATHERLRIRVDDHGRGFDLHAVCAASSGIAGMRERALLLGGQLTIATAPGAGTRVTAAWPLRSRVGRRQHERDHRPRGRS
jgi:PAS domain S-box-containing protein